MLEVLPKIPKMQASYVLGKPLALPMNLTISVSYRCNSRCKTCNVWQRPNDDFTIEEYDKTFASIGRAAYWFTFSGGEPTLRKDLPDMIASAYRHCRPGVINIPTNGIQDKIIPGRIEQVLKAAPTSEVIINLSLDGVGEKHDQVRGVKGNFERAMRTYAGLKALKGRYKNFTLGVHTVISNFNIDEFDNIHKFVREELKPDSFISEIAEERVELDTVGMGITPPMQKYEPVIEHLQEDIRHEQFSNLTARITQAFRDRYYDIVKRTFAEKRQIIPCLAGIASAQIAPNGDVWTCCIRAESVGNLREHNYDFGSVWRTAKADELRHSIKAGECYCPLANASYTNMVCHTPTVTSVGLEVAKGLATETLSGSKRGKSAKLRTLPVINAVHELAAAEAEEKEARLARRSVPMVTVSHEKSE
ncbi:radical SAM protein [Ktedonosporobacter rubrisoli]|uniref:Radical SAM protein n=1 Tax=Ktedonosporobacter rubrisoli TaxID=2509675 RepID=A0A4P6JXX9_KTERU|nr:radical SAM protein [Ktedonosporobacter rubrisoli]QBD80638.1 radical SAM protein [Ktedonosporobacter rubrisoli]